MYNIYVLGIARYAENVFASDMYVWVVDLLVKQQRRSKAGGVSLFHDKVAELHNTKQRTERLQQAT